jgi:6-phosphogluconolactonase
MRFLGIDHGDKRTGLALSDTAETLASPHSVIQTQNESYLIECIARLAAREAVDAVVVGLPLNMDGSEGPRAKRVRAFAEKLSAMVSVPIHFHDERLSSFAAESLFVGLEMTRKDKQKRLDAVAAANILQSYLDRHRSPAAPLVSPRIVRAADPEALADRAAAEWIAASQAAVALRGAFYVAISGGKTPRLFFERLARPDIAAQIPWDKTHLFWADERCVPPDSPDSNFSLAVDTFLHAVPIPPVQIYRIRGEVDDCVQAADAYEAVMQNVFDPAEGECPAFDLIVLGLGQDGHIASLLPGDPGLWVADRLTWPVYHETRFNRVTLTVPVLQNARLLLVLAAGAEKADIVHFLFTSPPAAERYPAYVLWPALERVLWLIDEAAAASL